MKCAPHLHLLHLQLKLANHVDVKVVHTCRETVGTSAAIKMIPTQRLPP
jgi:hypothetical protein